VVFSDLLACSAHFDPGPSITAVLVVVDNGVLTTDYGLHMNEALLAYSSHRDGKIRSVLPADTDKPIRYKRLEHFRTFHGDIYVFPGCAIEHGVCNPAINPEVGRQHAFKKMRRAAGASASFVHQCLGATR